jgi:hypothetical protein
VQVFEISDVVLKNPATEVGAQNHRRFAALIFNKSPGFEVRLSCMTLWFSDTLYRRFRGFWTT